MEPLNTMILMSMAIELTMMLTVLDIVSNDKQLVKLFIGNTNEKCESYSYRRVIHGLETNKVSFIIGGRLSIFQRNGRRKLQDYCELLNQFD
jgi:hypothetical protein